MSDGTEGDAKDRNGSDDLKPRGRSGLGSYESPADAARQKRRPGKTGRPGR